MHEKYNIHTTSDREQHIEKAKKFLSFLENQCVKAFLEVRAGEMVNPYVSELLKSCKLPLNYYYKISLIVKSINECSYDNSFLMLNNVFNEVEALHQFYQQSAHRVIELYIGVVDVLYVIFGRLPSQKASDSFLTRYLIYSFLDILEDKFKYHTMYLVTSLIPPSQPPKGVLDDGEVPGVFMGGWVRRYFISPNITIEEKLKAAMSLQNAKRAAAAISERKQLKATIDHQKNMTGKGYTATKEKEEEILPLIKKKLSKLVKIYYPRKLEEQIPIWRLPSQSSCLTHTKAGFGAMGAFREKYYEKDTISHFGDLGLAEDLKDPNSNYTIPLYSFGFDIDKIREGLFTHLYEVPTCHATFHKVLEPFKVRGITASDPENYHLGRLIQPMLHRYLRDEKGPFRFIGKRHNVEDINDVYAGLVLTSEDLRQRFISGDDWGDQFSNTFLVAGDFSSATDCMHPELPKGFVEDMAGHCKLSDHWVRVLNSTLGSHIIKYADCILDMKPILERYPDLAAEWNFSVRQTWGQLMGSPTSFPVLCLVNAACLWVATERYRRRSISWEVIQQIHRPLFNGDDASFASNKDHYDSWKEVCEVAGFGLSPGKNYCTKYFVNINSTNYKTCREECDGFTVITSLEEEFLVNPGLLKGRAKVLDDSREKSSLTEIESLMPVCDQLNECVRVASHAEKIRSYIVFLYHMEDRLCKSSRSWKLPRHLGGLGLPFGTANFTQLVTAWTLIEKYRDLSDIKESGEFVDMSKDYWQQLRDPILEKSDAQEIKTRVLFPTDIDPYEETILFEKPSLSPFFITSKKSFKDYDKKIILKKKKWIRKDIEYKFRDALDHVWCRKNKIIRSQLTSLNGKFDDMIKELVMTRLSKSGLTKELCVELRKPSKDGLGYDPPEGVDCMPWFLFH